MEFRVKITKNFTFKRKLVKNMSTAMIISLNFTSNL